MSACPFQRLGEPVVPGTQPFVECGATATHHGTFTDGAEIDCCRDHADRWSAAAPLIRWTENRDAKGATP